MVTVTSPQLHQYLGHMSQIPRLHVLAVRHVTHLRKYLSFPRSYDMQVLVTGIPSVSVTASARHTMKCTGEQVQRQHVHHPISS